MLSFARLSTLRLVLVLLLGTLALSGCVTGEGDDRHLQPLPARLVSEMSSKGMSQSDPILVRIFKKESELEVWKRDRSGQYALLKTYPMCRWSGQLGPKKREGDRQETPLQIVAAQNQQVDGDRPRCQRQHQHRPLDAQHGAVSGFDWGEFWSGVGGEVRFGHASGLGE